MAESEAEEKSPGAGGSAEAFGWMKLETSYLKLSKDYGYSGEALVSFVERKLTEATDRDQRAQERAERIAEKELDSRKEIEKLQAASGSGSNDAQKRPHKLDVPKYTDKQDIRHYLITFEAVVQQNGYEKSTWLLALRSAAMGTKLEPVLDYVTTYESAKVQVTRSFGKTAEKTWSELLSLHQQTEDTFFRCLAHVVQQVQEWASLSGGPQGQKQSSGNSEMFMAIVRQFVLQGCSLDLCAYLLENKIGEKTLEEITELGTAYQEAHGVRSGSDQKPMAWEPEGASAQCFTLSTAEDENKLHRMPVAQRREHAQTNGLCYRCLRTGHSRRMCDSSVTCSKCGNKHHTLLHDDSSNGSSDFNNSSGSSSGSSNSHSTSAATGNALSTA